jgi:DNA-binding CsgD family transcriptional regulator/predicted DCC family thiol-disulfide oxidoreductase YuxK
MKKLADQKRQEFMAWLTSHPHLADISKHIVVDFLNAHDAKQARICLIKDNNDLEVVSEFGFDEKETKLGVISETAEWQDRNDATFKVVAGISMDAWISDDMVYVCPLKVNNVNIGYAQIYFKQYPDKEEMAVILDDLGTGLSLYLNYQKQLNQYYKDIELLALALRVKEGDDLKRIKTLSARQRTIIELISLGNTNKQIAMKLGFSEATIHADTSEIYRLLGVDGRKEATALLAQHLASEEAKK